MSDPLSNYNFGNGGSGLYLSEFPAKIRVLTTDPVVHMEEKYGSTKFAFVVWNHDLGKAQILDRGSSIAKQIQELHLSDDWGGNIQAVDIRINSTGEGKDTRYTVTPLPNSKPLTNEQIKEAAGIDLMAKIKNGVRMSEAVQKQSTKPMPRSMVDDAAMEDIQDDIDQGEEVDLADIPF